MRKGRLDSWKEISKYLDRDIRTCQRWERYFGLPVWRVNKQSLRSKVFSFKSEIDLWLKNRFKNQYFEEKILSRKKWLFLSILITISAVVCILLFSFFLKKKEVLRPSFYPDLNPARWALKGNYLAFYDLKDNFLWSAKINNPASQREYYFENELSRNKGQAEKKFNTNKVDFSDIDKDGMNEVLCFLNHENSRERCIVLFDNDGQKLWSKSVEFNQEYKGGKIINNYVIQQLEFKDINNDNDEEILALWVHNPRFPSIFAVYDHKGKELLKYCHTGRLQFFIIDTNEKIQKRIFLGGTNNLLDGDAVLAVLDCRRLKSGLAPPYNIPPDLAEKDSLRVYIPENYNPAYQKYYLRFRHNELSKIETVKWLNVFEIHAGENEIIVTVDFGFGKTWPLHYIFDSDFNLRYVLPGADLEREYMKLLKEGIIRTPFANFIKQSEKDVLFWNGKGWSEKPTN